MGLRSKTKIICTVGPASADLKTLEQMFLNGMSIVRLNMSHGTQEEHIQTIRHVRMLEAKYRSKIFISLDTRGPELRVECDGALDIKEGDTVRIVPVSHAPYHPTDAVHLVRVNLPCLEGIEPGSIANLDDSKLILRVLHSSDACVEAVASNHHVLKNQKRIHFESLARNGPFVGPADAASIRFGAENSVDAIFVSFVQCAADLADIKSILDDSSVQIISKIESRAALQNIEDILDASDGIMVARGDLMNDVGVGSLFSSQKLLSGLSKRTNVIMATEMLQSMVESRTPLRAEVSDIGNAVLDGCSAIMLSSETSVGKYPAECVETMRCVAVDAERYAEPEDADTATLEWKGNTSRSSMLVRGVYFSI